MDIRIGENEANLARVLAALATAANQGANLIVFPECALSGYCFGNLDEARPYLRKSISPESEEFSEACAALGVTGVLGFLEDEPYEDGCSNSALLCLPDHTR